MCIVLCMFTQWKHKKELSYDMRCPNVDIVTIYQLFKGMREGCRILDLWGLTQIIKLKN